MPSLVVTRARLIQVAAKHIDAPTDHAALHQATEVVDAILGSLRADVTVPRGIPLMDDYFASADRLAKLVRRRLDGHSVSRGQMRQALEAFERIDYQAM